MEPWLARCNFCTLLWYSVGKKNLFLWLSNLLFGASRESVLYALLCLQEGDVQPRLLLNSVWLIMSETTFPTSNHVQILNGYYLSAIKNVFHSLSQMRKRLLTWRGTWLCLISIQVMLNEVLETMLNSNTQQIFPSLFSILLDSFAVDNSLYTFYEMHCRITHCIPMCLLH